MKLAIMVTFASLAVVLVGAGDSAGSYIDKPRTLCGRHLANARFVYCFGATEDMRKRFTYTSPFLALLQPRRSTTVELEGQQDTLRGNLPASKVKRIGIADACCLKPCYISELLNYC